MRIWHMVYIVQQYLEVTILRLHTHKPLFPPAQTQNKVYIWVLHILIVLMDIAQLPQMGVGEVVRTIVMVSYIEHVIS